jgi:hypothetical protein
LTARRRPPAWVVGVAGLAISAAVVLRILILSGMEASAFLGLGDDSPIQTEYARERLGEVPTRAGGGHDGKFFFVQANDPWYLHPARHAAVIDQPMYRGQRMLYPMIAGGLGSFPPAVIVWSMLVTNIIAIAVGSWLGARLAARWGGSSWLGLAIPLNVGLIFEVLIDGAGVIAYVFCLGALYALETDRRWTAAVLFAAAALSREVMILFAIGVLIVGWLAGRRIQWRIVVVPALAMMTWYVYLRSRLTGVTGVGGGPENFAPPFAGMWQASRSWATAPDDLLLSAAILVAVVSFTLLAVRGTLSIAWGALPFVALAMVLSVNVWREPFDLARVLAPVFTAAPFILFVSERGTTPPAAEQPSSGPR